MKFHLAFEQGYIPMSDTVYDRLVVYFDEEPRHGTFLTLAKPYSIEKFIEGLGEWAEELRAGLQITEKEGD